MEGLTTASGGNEDETNINIHLLTPAPRPAPVGKYAGTIKSVNTLQGTNSSFGLTRGITYPALLPLHSPRSHPE